MSDLEGDRRAIARRLADRFAEAIDAGRLGPGARLPTTRQLAERAGINATTAARVYRRLAELGYVTASVGRGTFVRALPPFPSEEAGDDWQAVALPAPAPASRERLLQEAMRLAQSDGVVSLAAGMPAPETLPVAELARHAAAAFAELGPAAVGYTDVEGVPELREQLGRLGAQLGFASGPDEILVTSGARQGLDLVARTLLRPGDVVCVESPSFVGTLASLEATGARLIGIPSDADGLDVEALERAASRHPVKLVALQPACQNPTGRHLSAGRRARLLGLARERSFFVLEDAVYARPPFRGETPPPLRGEAPGHVLYVDSLSKTLGGGLRIGWIAARGPIFDRLVALKMSTDLHSPALPQHVAARYLASGAHERLLASLRRFYARRAAALLAALEAQLPGEHRLLEPLGGHSVWVTLTRPVDERALYLEATRRGVSVTPGSAALVERSRRTSLRLSFSLAGEEELHEGVRRLAAAYRAVLRAERYGATAAVA
ncbi:MAG TPA: PLP-dependent aminotransferase family protein [Gaiellaceae bacterium]|nr:PLP-dependent aminotransferase family protein [Gaiellaceae bacterium]